MLNENEYNEGRKDAKTDLKNKTKRDISRYPSEAYQKGYSIQWARGHRKKKDQKKIWPLNHRKKKR